MYALCYASLLCSRALGFNVKQGISQLHPYLSLNPDTCSAHAAQVYKPHACKRLALLRSVCCTKTPRKAFTILCLWDIHNLIWWRNDTVRCCPWSSTCDLWCDPKSRCISWLVCTSDQKQSSLSRFIITIMEYLTHFEYKFLCMLLLAKNMCCFSVEIKSVVLTT